MKDNNVVPKHEIRFLISSMFSSRGFLAGFLDATVVVTLMYYNTMLRSHMQFPIQKTAHELVISIILGVDVTLAVTANIYVMKIVMGGGEEVKKVATKTVLSMAAGACACVGSFSSLLISLGVSTGVGFLALLYANLPVFFLVAGLLSLLSLKLAASTLWRDSHLLNRNSS